MNNLITILYVKDQDRSKEFYAELLEKIPSIDVPGMTEFILFDNCALGLMPEDGISKIISPAVTHPSKGNMIPRCELYLRVDDASKYFNKAIELGAINVSAIQKRDWGETVGYVSDFDGHILAFAEK